MKRLVVALFALSLAFYIGSVLNQRGFTQTPETTSPVGDASTSAVTKTDFQSFLEPFIYDIKGRRDPFKPYVEMKAPEEGDMQGPLLPLQRYNIEEIILTGIIWDVKNPKALFIDPSKQTHILGRDDRIGKNNGYIAVIREGEVVVVEAQRIRGETVFSTRVMKLSR